MSDNEIVTENASSALERRGFALEARDVREVRDGFDFRGYAAVFNSPSEPLRDRFGTFTEVIKPGAFARALENKQDVMLTRDHDPKQLLGRTSSGTVVLKEDSRGLEVRATLPNTTLGRDTAEMISRRDLNGMSFVFQAAPGGSSFGFEGEARTRTLTDFAVLADVSVVAQPAYAGTDADVEMRAIYDAIYEAREGKMISAANKELLSSIVEQLQQLIADEQAEAQSEVAARMMQLDLIERYGI